MARPPHLRTGARQVAVHLAQYAGARSFAWLFGAFPPEQNLRTAAFTADAWARMNPHRLERATGNIRRSLPHLTDAECMELSLESVRYMFRTYMVDAFQLPLQERDVLLLCSDGLYSQVGEEEIAKTLGKADPQDACELLVEQANRQGGRDNITAIVLRLDRLHEASQPSAPQQPSGRTGLARIWSRVGKAMGLGGGRDA